MKNLVPKYKLLTSKLKVGNNENITIKNNTLK